ncbi:MAG TPA: hypothetical protein VHS56_03010 [Candidatus Cybelea sp.]|jgi:hypothetical protein|nr:hypothetical protein [Candidatus Cybelea sp.]
MRFNLRRINLAAAAAALSLSIVACHGASPGGSSYVPAGSTALSAPQAGSGLAAPDAKRTIVSSCGKHVRIVLLGFLNCKFRESGYGDGTFTLTNHTKGLVVISPSSGTRETTFNIAAALLGSGHFLVKDAKGRSLRVGVKVTL